MKKTLFTRTAKITLVLFSLFLAACAVNNQQIAQPAAEPSYNEQYRPQVHFSPPSMWMNDPNGLVYYEGEYHLFYQYYPGDTVWGPMHWGHAVSHDLVHWENLPIALYPDQNGYIFSGSAVVDWKNTSGFGAGEDPPLVAVFTYHDPERGKLETNDHETQGLAYSNDHGRSWTKYAGNPVLPNAAKNRDFRDPNVIWHEESKQWVMALSVFDQVEFWGSANLKEWRLLSSFGQEWGAHGGTWECPDLFPLNVTGTDETRWVLILNLNPGGPQGGSGTQYFVGDFDGTRFVLDDAFADTLKKQEAVWLDWGADNYAGVTWSDVPGNDDQRVFIGWMSNWEYAQQVPTSPWRSAMTLPRSLTLVDTPEGYRLVTQPVEALALLRTDRAALPAMRVSGAEDLTKYLDFPTAPFEITARFDTADHPGAIFGFEISNRLGERYRIGFDAMTSRFFSDRTGSGNHDWSETFADRVHWAPRHSRSKILDMRLVFDTASVELFADGGATAITEIFFPTEPFDQLHVFSEKEAIEFLGGDVYRLDSIWAQ